MKQIKMNLSEEPKAALKSDEDCRKKQNLRTVRKVLFMVGGGIGCFVLGGKYNKLCIDTGLQKIFDNYPDVEKALVESIRDYCDKIK